MTYTIELQPSGHRFEVSEDDVILDRALAEGLRMPHGCRAGTCKSCKAKVVSGTVDLGRAFPAPAFMLRLRQMNGYTLMCRATATSDLVIEVDETRRLPPPRFCAATVSHVEFVETDVAIVRLRMTSANPFHFIAGQYVDVLLPGDRRRSYSIANPPRHAGIDEIEFHIRHLPGGVFTDRLFADGPRGRLAVGDELTFEGPLGSFYLREGDAPALMVASGTGYAPIRSILLDSLAQYPERPFTLYWGARRRSDIYKFEEVAALTRVHPNFRFVPVLSEADDGWTGRVGFVHRAVMDDMPDLAALQTYACGTPVMVEAARRDFVAQCRLPADQFFADSFLTQADLATV